MKKHCEYEGCTFSSRKSTDFRAVAVPKVTEQHVLENLDLEFDDLFDVEIWCTECFENAGGRSVELEDMWRDYEEEGYYND